MLFRARSWKEAEEKALREARAYAAAGEEDLRQLRWGRKRVIDACAVCIVPGEPSAGQLVFWRHAYVKRNVPIKEIVDKKLDGVRRSLSVRPEWILRQAER